VSCVSSIRVEVRKDRQKGILSSMMLMVNSCLSNNIHRS
jgi:hypothetical protein